MNLLKTGNSYFGAGSYVKYKFGGKELQETGMYDFGARMYMADIGRWFAADPLAETNPGLSVYRYGFNNPVMFTDPNGMLEKALTNRMLELGGTWKNEGNGFESDEHIKLDYNGSYMSLNTNLDDNFNRIINIPGVNMAGKHNQWGQAFQDKFNSYMNSWNTNNFNNYIAKIMYQIQNSTSGNYVRAIPSSNSPEVAIANPSGQLAIAGLYGLQGGTSALATEYVAAKTGLTFLSMFGRNAGFSWSSLNAMESSSTSIFSTAELIPTHAITKSKTQMQTLLNDVAVNGVTEPIKYVEFNGQNYIVDGHHRFFSAQRAGISHVPVEQVQLPYGFYKTSQHLMMEGSNPGYWRYMNVK